MCVRGNIPRWDAGANGGKNEARKIYGRQSLRGRWELGENRLMKKNKIKNGAQ